MANGLEHRVLAWETNVERPLGTVLLLHGFLDAAGTWDRVAPRLAAAGHRVLAPDMRGFGDGDRAPRGSYYHFADYVADLAELVSSLAVGAPLFIVGHSMGGTIATLYAGAFPENTSRLAVLEGLGPPDHPFAAAPARMRTWIESVRALRSRAEPEPFEIGHALRRLVLNHPGVPREILEHRLPHLVRSVGDRVVWRNDPLHRTTAPTPFYAGQLAEFQKRVACPVLFVSGGPTGFHPPDEAERLAAFANVTTTTLGDAGHMMHWTQPEALSDLLLAFVAPR